MKFTPPNSHESRTLEQICTELKDAHELTGSWEQAGKAFGLNKATARLVAMGREPGKKVRAQLGLPDVRWLVVIGNGEVPPGAQVTTAAQCSCGQWYVPNHPRRQRCYICSPYKGKRKR